MSYFLRFLFAILKPVIGIGLFTTGIYYLFKSLATDLNIDNLNISVKTCVILSILIYMLLPVSNNNRS